jgi:hypothetical protein
MRGLGYRCSAMVCVLVLAGCGKATDANKTNFGAAIEHFLSENGDLCLGLTKWPIDTEPSQEGLYAALGASRAPQLRALEDAGVVVGTVQTMERANIFGGRSGVTTQVVRYDLTEQGKKSYRGTGTHSSGSRIADRKFMDLCIGRLALDKVVSWEELVEAGRPKQARVSYTYRIDGLTDWAKDKRVHGAFRPLALAVDGIGKEKRAIVLKLTSEGWEVAGQN